MPIAYFYNANIIIIYYIICGPLLRICLWVCLWDFIPLGHEGPTRILLPLNHTHTYLNELYL